MFATPAGCIASVWSNQDGLVFPHNSVLLMIIVASCCDFCGECDECMVHLHSSDGMNLRSGYDTYLVRKYDIQLRLSNLQKK
jgi:hypothetical protein